jgi:tetrahydromethanopterin S-methyltransferase subunit G
VRACDSRSATREKISASGGRFDRLGDGLEFVDGELEVPRRVVVGDRIVNPADTETVDDAIEDALSSDVEFSGNRFTDNPMVDFDVAEFGGDKAAPTDKDAPGGDTPDDTTSMSDDSDIKEKLETLEQRLDDIEEKHSNDDSDKNADDTGDSALEEKLDSLEEKLDNLAEASGKSQQLDGGDSTESKTSKADVLGLPGGDN